jgi:hypothetical protein
MTTPIRGSPCKEKFFKDLFVTIQAQSDPYANEDLWPKMAQHRCLAGKNEMALRMSTISNPLQQKLGHRYIRADIDYVIYFRAKGINVLLPCLK